MDDFMEYVASIYQIVCWLVLQLFTFCHLACKYCVQIVCFFFNTVFFSPHRNGYLLGLAPKQFYNAKI